MEVKSIIKGFIAGLALSIYPYAGGLWQLPYTLGQQMHNHLTLSSNMIFIITYYYFVLDAASLGSIATKECIETSKKNFLEANVGIASYMITYSVIILAMSLMFLLSDYDNAYNSLGFSSCIIALLTFVFCTKSTDSIINKLLLVINKR